MTNRSLSTLFIIASYFALVPALQARTGFLDENFRIGFESYAYDYTLTHGRSHQNSAHTFSSFNRLQIEYDSRFNIYGEINISLSNLHKSTVSGLGYFITPQVAMGANLVISHASLETIKQAKSNDDRQQMTSSTDFLLNPYARIIYKLNSRVHLDFRPGILFAHLSSNDDASLQALGNSTRALGLTPTTGLDTENASYTAFGMNMTGTVRVELIRDIFYRGGLTFGFLSGNADVTNSDHTQQQSQSHLLFEVNFAQLVYQF